MISEENKSLNAIKGANSAQSEYNNRKVMEANNRGMTNIMDSEEDQRNNSLVDDTDVHTIFNYVNYNTGMKKLDQETFTDIYEAVRQVGKSHKQARKICNRLKYVKNSLDLYTLCCEIVCCLTNTKY